MFTTAFLFDSCSISCTWREERSMFETYNLVITILISPPKKKKV